MQQKYFHAFGNPVRKVNGQRHQARRTFPAEQHRDRFSTFVLLLLLALVATYSNHFFNSFQFDDFHTIVNNNYIRSLRNIPLFFTDATTFSSLPANQSYRPLVTTTLAFDYFLGNGNVFFFHLSAFILFLLQGYIMYVFYNRVLARLEPGLAHQFVALAAVAWYMLHPANAETINYIIARSDLLSTLFILLAFAMYISGDIGRRRFLYLIPVAMGCLAKPITAVFAPLFLLYVYLFENGNGPAMARISASLKKTLPAFLTCLLMLFLIKAMDPPTWRAGGASAFHYQITQPFVILHYFSTFFLPISLNADTDWTTLPSLFDVRFLIGVMFLSGLLAAAVATAQKERLKPVSFGIGWFLISLLPTSIMPLAEVMNDHRLFLPYVGLTLSVSWTAYLILSRLNYSFGFKEPLYRVTTAAIIVVLAIYAYGAHLRNDVWRTEETLWLDVTIKSPKNGRGLMNYGLTLMGRKDYENAEKYFNEAMKLVPHYCYLYVNMGILKDTTGKTAEAELHFRKAISLSPDWPDGYYYYADFLKKQKRYDEAILYAKKTLQLTNAHLNARKLLTTINRELGRFP